MTYKPTQKEPDEAMESMECWQTQEHLKKCSKCRNSYLESVIPKKKEIMINEDHIDRADKIGFNYCVDTIRINAGLEKEEQ